MNDNELLKKIQQVELNSLRTLDRICKKYDLSYFAVDGTLLGAVRHGGFIPWDDDVDVGMLRADYQKLKKVPEWEWQEGGCVFLTPESSDSRHDKLFPRVYADRTRIQSKRDVDCWKELGTGKSWSTSLMLDIFVFDYVPDDEAKRKEFYNRMGRLRRLYHTTKARALPQSKSMKSRFKTTVRNAYGAMMRRKYKNPGAQMEEELIREASHICNGGNRLGVYCADYPQVFEYGDVFPLDHLPFDDIQIPVPNSYEKVLTMTYGDWKKVPPEEERGHIQFIFVDFGDGDVRVIDPIPGSLGAELIDSSHEVPKLR